MPASSNLHPVWIDRPAALQRMVADLVNHSLLAVDTESNSMYVYREQVCLIQFSTPETDYLVDPLALTDLSSLAPIFVDPQIEKIFHAAEYDLICLKRDFGFEFNHIFDTMIAARILGRSNLGLSAMLQDEFGIELDKRFQRANWGRRPIPAPMLEYARMDTHYLIPLRNRLKAALEECGRWPIAQEDFRREAAVIPPATENNANTCWRVASGQELSPTQAAVLNALCRYREQQAKKANLPPFKILSNRVLLQIALELPRTPEELATVEGFSQRNLQQHGAGLLAAIRKGLQDPPPHRPHDNRPLNDLYYVRLDALRNWRKETGQRLGVPSDVILPRDVLETIARTQPKSMDELAAVMGDLPWRLEHFGKHILRIVNR
jgi:ribonuclease D